MEFYGTSARILDIVLSSDEPAVSLKSLCAKHAAAASPARCYALVAETLKYLPVIQRLVKSVDLVSKESKVLSKKASPSPSSLAHVLVHDLLFSKKGIALPKEHKVRAAVERYATRLKANKQREKLRLHVTNDEDLQVSIEKYLDGPDLKGKGKAKASHENELDGRIRWLRVNEVKWTTEDAVAWLEEQGWKACESLEGLVEKAGRSYHVDAHISNLIAVPVHAVNLPKFPPYQDARFIAQDKASCMPAYLLLTDLDDEYEPVVIDATSAPGNKTSYAAATLSRLGRGQVYAFERDDKRYPILRKMIHKAGCKNVTSVHADFLETDPSEEPYANATHILVDPSCSGSGIHSDYDPTTSLEDLQARLKPLSKFQRHILSAALRFPTAKKVAYSTCSIHTEEDEEVVFDVIDSDEFSGVWRVQTRQKTLPSWPLRGKDPHGRWEGREDELQGMIRCERRLGTHGFFVAILTRVQEQDGEAEEEFEQESPEPTPKETKVSGTRSVPVKPSKEGKSASAAWVADAPAFSLLRLATLDRKRRRRQQQIWARGLH